MSDKVSPQPDAEGQEPPCLNNKVKNIIIGGLSVVSVGLAAGLIVVATSTSTCAIDALNGTTNTDTSHGTTDTSHGTTDTSHGTTDTSHGTTDTSHGTTSTTSTNLFSSTKLAMGVGKMFGTENQCNGTKLELPNKDCLATDIAEQAGANVTYGYQGDLHTTVLPILTPYFEAGLCPVNVHWHLGAEHYSFGEYDESGTGPSEVSTSGGHRRAAGTSVRQGFQCHFYDADDVKFNTAYDWQHCVGMQVGQTYEVHWPHSKMGACGTVDQYQTPFYDGVFCHADKLVATHTDIGVQSQVYTIVNDEDYYYPNMIDGMIVDGTEYGHDMAYYTGSTTGTTRDNDICSSYTPITWHVDRECHLISASSFDKMCADMKMKRDDMDDDLYAHGSRELVDDSLAANNHQYFS